MIASFVFAWNDEVIVPQGLQDHPRTLVFVDDVGPAPGETDPASPGLVRAGEGSP